MSVVRVVKRDLPYTVICNIGLNDIRLSNKAKGILCYLLSKPDNWSVRIEDIANNSADKKPSIKTGLQELKLFGYASLEVVRGGRGQVVGKEWVVYEVPQLYIEKLSANRQAENLVVGESPTTTKTDDRFNRRSVKPTIGKPAQLVSTDYVVNTDTLLNTDTVRTGHENQKNENLQSVDQCCPPNSARPPAAGSLKAVPFFESPVYAAGVDKFREALVGMGVLNTVDFTYYFNRLGDWRGKDGKIPTNANWLAMGQKFISGDSQAGKLVTIVSAATAAGKHQLSPRELYVQQEF